MSRKQKQHQFHMRADGEFFDRIDEWRAKRKPLPTRSEAVRLLVQSALKADGIIWDTDPGDDVDEAKPSDEEAEAPKAQRAIPAAA